jgi:hypothetical protein
MTSGPVRCKLVPGQLQTAPLLVAALLQRWSSDGLAVQLLHVL